MEPVRYRPGEALRWLEMGADDFRGQAERQGKDVIGRRGARNLGKDLREVAGAIADLSRGAVADFLAKQAEASEYVLHPDYFEVVTAGKVRTYRYVEIFAIKLEDETATLVLEKGALTIKPFGHVVAGRVKVPIGWDRNGFEVPYGLLLDEIAARCKLRIDLG